MRISPYNRATSLEVQRSIHCPFLAVPERDNFPFLFNSAITRSILLLDWFVEFANSAMEIRLLASINVSTLSGSDFSALSASIDVDWRWLTLIEFAVWTQHIDKVLFYFLGSFYSLYLIEWFTSGSLFFYAEYNPPSVWIWECADCFPSILGNLVFSLLDFKVILFFAVQSA